jgi:hypothetical protein
MSLYRYIMLPFSLIALTFFGFDRVAVEWHSANLRKDLSEAAGDTSVASLRMQPAERVRIALRKEEAKARARGESYIYNLRNFPDRIEIDVRATYRTKISHYMGKETLPSEFKLVLNLDR